MFKTLLRLLPKVCVFGVLSTQTKTCLSTLIPLTHTTVNGVTHCVSNRAGTSSAFGMVRTNSVINKTVGKTFLLT